jgi:hypothetical protein
MPPMCSGLEFSPGFTCVSGNSILGFYVTSPLDYRAGADPSSSSTTSGVAPCLLSPYPHPIVDYVVGPNLMACYVGCRYGTIPERLELYLQTARDLATEPPVEYPNDNIFAMSTEVICSLFLIIISSCIGLFINQSSRST